MHEIYHCKTHKNIFYDYVRVKLYISGICVPFMDMITDNNFQRGEMHEMAVVETKKVKVSKI